VAQRDPDEIWEEALDEGERRLKRGLIGLAASGFAGGAEVAIGILIVTVVSGAVADVAPQELSHIAGSLLFGTAFVFITLGRAELFTENFHIPVGAVYARRAPVIALVRMWVVTLAFNLAGMALILRLLSIDGVLQPATLEAAGPLADTFAARDVPAAFVSAVLAGTVITLFTWVISAAASETARVLASLLVGFVLVAPSLNHAVVGFGEMLFGLLAGTTGATGGELWGNLGIAVAGNLVGGVGLVFLTRLAQVRGEPDAHGTGRRPPRR
jgi:formate/nitrite transporter FocA (FNT family)